MISSIDISSIEIMYYTKLYFESNGVSTYDLYMRLISTDAQIILKYLDAFLLLHSNINVTIKCQMTGYEVVLSIRN